MTGQAQMSSAAVTLLAYDVLRSALEAGGTASAIEAARSKLDGLTRDEVARVATAVAVESMRRLTPAGDRAQLVSRLERARVEAMWAAS